MAVSRNVTMPFEARCSCTILNNVKLHPGRCSFFCWSLLLIFLPIPFMLPQWQFLMQIPFLFPSKTQTANCRNYLSSFNLSPLGFSSPILTFLLISSSTSLPGFPLCVIPQFHTLIFSLRQHQFSHTPPQNLSYSHSPLLLSFPLIPRLNLAPSSPVSTHLFLILFSISLSDSHS